MVEPTSNALAGVMADASDSRTTGQSFTCNTCSLSFQASGEQRTHMRTPWHVHNLKRRMASLPPISGEVFDEQAILNAASKGSEQPESDRLDNSHVHDSSEDDEELDSEGEHDDNTEAGDIVPSRCFFCNLDLPSVDINLDHMSSQHGLFIPEPDWVVDMETFLGYLATIVLEHHDCLYCGLTKSSAQGIQQHMRDRGHCMINFDLEPELFEFWDFAENDADSEAVDNTGDNIDSSGSSKGTIGKPVPKLHKLSETELLLPSGTVVGSRSESPHASYNHTGQRAAKQDKIKAIVEGENSPKTVRDRQVAVRGELGLIGVSGQQKRALVVAEKKMQKREAVARAAHMWAREKIANRQKHYRPDNPSRPNG